MTALVRKHQGSSADWDRWVDEFFMDPWSGFFGGPRISPRVDAKKPFPVDIKLFDDRIELLAELPGVRAENLEVKLESAEQKLTIVAERAEGELPEGLRRLRQERSVGRFARSFRLPDDVVDEEVEALLKDGVLSLTIRRAEPEAPKSIKIRTA